MKKDCKYYVRKEIPLDKNGEKKIKVGTDITRMHGVYFMNGGMLSREYQEDFDHLIEMEEKHGWNYLVPDNPIVGKSLVGM